MIPVLADILIIGLVYRASIAKAITEWIIAFSVKFTNEIVVKSVKTVAKFVFVTNLKKSF